MVLFLGCLCVVANEMKVLLIAFGCSVVFLVVFVWLPMKSAFCGFPLDVLLFETRLRS